MRAQQYGIPHIATMARRPFTGRVGALLLTATMLALAPTLSATAQTIQWYVEVLTDPITKSPVLEARILTNKGYRFHLMKRDDNSVWAEFRMPRHIQQQISRKRLPTYWVDRNDPVDLEALKSLEVGFKPTLFKIGEKGIQFILWGAFTPGQVPPPLRKFMLGETLNVRYWNGLGEMRQAQIPLKRANEAIAQMLNLQPLKKTEQVVSRQRTESFDTVAKKYLEFCEELRFVGKDDDFGYCRSRFVFCSESPDQSEESFRNCINEAQ